MRRRRFFRFLAGLLVLLAAGRLWMAATSGQDHPFLDRLRGDTHPGSETNAAPPRQPAAGPGGKSYPYDKVRESVFGEGAGQFRVFEPAAAVPVSASSGSPSETAASDSAKTAAALPVIVFAHGWGAMEPGGYGAWIEHLVKRGNIVIYPRYQESLRTRMEDFTPNAVAEVKAALKELAAGGHARADLGRVAVVGHSMGGAIAPNLAAMAAKEGLPRFSAVMCVEPGNRMMNNPKIHMPMADLSLIPANTLLIMLVGSDDKVVRDETAKEIYSGASNVASANKNYVTMMSDHHGTPPLVANHFAPAAPGGTFESGGGDGGSKGPLRDRIGEWMREKKGGTQPMVDALDFYGTWKLFDGLTDAAFFGKNREYALGDTPQQRFMGVWSDGVAAKELKVEMTAEALSRSRGIHGATGTKSE
jgi:acetyl esterase/lipase